MIDQTCSKEGLKVLMNSSERTLNERIIVSIITYWREDNVWVGIMSAYNSQHPNVVCLGVFPVRSFKGGL